MNPNLCFEYHKLISKYNENNQNQNDQASEIAKDNKKQKKNMNNETTKNEVKEKKFENKRFEIDLQSNRMGFRLKSDPIFHTIMPELLSTAVTRGTLQLTPAGQLIVLMADHQTTGGYPRIGTVISADMASLAQMPIGSSFRITWVSTLEAEALLLAQESNLQQLENACKFRLQEYFSEK